MTADRSRCVPVAVLALAVLAASACTPGPARLQARLARLAEGERPPPGDTWPLPPATIEHDFLQHDLDVQEHEPIGEGVTGAAKQQIVVQAHGDKFKIKWKDSPGKDVDGWNNAPRKEIAAYEIQKWFLDPVDYVVPTTALRCVPLERYRAALGAGEPTVPETQCVLGTVTIWLENVIVPDDLYERARFFRDRRYAYHMVSFNLLTYLIDHRDGREGNFLVSKNARNRRVFAVDNGIAFGAVLFNYFVPNWNDIRVPALRREAIERLRHLDPQALERLGVLSEMQADDTGMLRHVEPTPNADPERGVRIRPGWIQLGLTRAEIAAVSARLQALLASVDAGEVPVY